jgi:hypothetical protein
VSVNKEFLAFSSDLRSRNVSALEGRKAQTAEKEEVERMTLRFTRSVVGLAAAGLLLGAAAANAAPRNMEIRGDGTCAGGITGTISGTVVGGGLGKADIVPGGTAISVNGAADYALPSITPNGCAGADGTITFLKSGANLLVDVAGVVCENGVSGAGTAVLPNDAFEGSYIVDGGGSTGLYAGYTGAGNAVLGCYGGGEGAFHLNGSLNTP